MSDTKVTLLGNCQTKALSWYIQQLNQTFDVQWIMIQRFAPTYWAPEPFFEGKPVNVITDLQEATKALQSSDYVIFQHIEPTISKNYNFGKLKTYVKKSKLISITSMRYQPDDPDQENLKGMIERERLLNIDVRASKIIEKHGSKITMKEANHPHVYYFLELVREICAKTGWDYYSNEQYNRYLQEGYPFG